MKWMLRVGRWGRQPDILAAVADDLYDVDDLYGVEDAADDDDGDVMMMMIMIMMMMMLIMMMTVQIKQVVF